MSAFSKHSRRPLARWDCTPQSASARGLLLRLLIGFLPSSPQPCLLASPTQVDSTTPSRGLPPPATCVRCPVLLGCLERRSSVRTTCSCGPGLSGTLSIETPTTASCCVVRRTALLCSGDAGLLPSLPFLVCCSSKSSLLKSRSLDLLVPRCSHPSSATPLRGHCPSLASESSGSCSSPSSEWSEQLSAASSVPCDLSAPDPFCRCDSSRIRCVFSSS